MPVMNRAVNFIANVAASFFDVEDVFIVDEPEYLVTYTDDTGALDVTDLFGGFVAVYSITGEGVTTDNEDGTAVIDRTAVAQYPITLTAENINGIVSFETILDVRNPLHSILAFDRASQRDKTALTSNSSAIVAQSYVAPGGQYEPVSTVAVPETPPGIDVGDFAEWDAVNALGVEVGSYVAEVQTSGSNHEYAGASLVQEIGQALTVYVMGNGRNTNVSTQNQVRCGLSNGDDTLGSATVNGSNITWLRSFTIPTTNVQREVWVSVRVPSVVDFWSGVGAIWAVADTGRAGEWLEQEAGVSPVLTGPSVTYHFDPQNGDDANDGTTQALAKASPPTGLPPGSTIVGHGSLTAPYLWRVSGTEANPITFDATDLTIDLSEKVTGFTASTDQTYRAPMPAEQDIIDVVLYQDGSQLGLAQLPTPTDLSFAEDVYRDYALADDVTPTTLDVDLATTVGITDPAGLVNQAFIIVWNRSNTLLRFPITAQSDLGGGITRLTFDNGGFNFLPYDTADKKRFAIINHPDCMQVPGQYYRDAVTDEIVMRGHGDADLSLADVYYPAGTEDAMRVEGNYFNIDGLTIVGCGGDHSLIYNRVTGGTVTNLEVVGGNNYVCVACFDCENVLMDGPVVRDSSGRGFMFRDGLNTGVYNGFAERIKGSIFTCYGATNHWWVGCTAGIIYDAHGNCFTNYLGPLGVMMANCTTRSNKLGCTFQNTKGGCKIIGCDFVSVDSRTVLSLYDPGLNDPNGEGDLTFVANTAIDLGGNNNALRVGEIAKNGLVNALNVLQGNQVDQKQSLTPGHVTIDTFTLVDAGANHDYRGRTNVDNADVYFRSQNDTGALVVPQFAFVTDVRNSEELPTGRESFAFADSGRWADIADVPANPVICAQEEGGTPIQINITYKPFGPLISESNYMLDASRHYEEFTLAQMGDIDGSATADTVLTDIDPSTPLADIDTAPSGLVDMGQYSPITVALDAHPLFPGAPASLTFDRPGAHLPNGDRQVDTSGWLVVA